MKAAIHVGVNEPLIVEDVSLDPPRDGEVHVKWSASGVCHSDVSVWNGSLPVPAPNILGHEGAGIVVAAGQTDAGFAAGDHVIGNFRPMCGKCFYCTRDQTYNCKNSMAISMGRSPWQRADGSRVIGGVGGLGTFAEESVVHEGALVKVPADYPLELAALIGCGVTTGVGAVLFAAKVEKGSTCVVIGCGGVGHSVVQGCRLAEAENIIAVDVNAAKRKAAEAGGATHTVDPASEDLNRVVRGLTEKRGADYTFEVVGVPALQRQAYDLARPGGTVVWVGIPKVTDEVALPSAVMVLQNKRVLGTIYGSANVRRDMLTIIDYSVRGELDVAGMVTQRIGLAEVNEAFTAMLEGDVVRSVIVYD
jgi:S-(hydroxymethyl)glutathione dehydrogenase/alcohol dehydrogenase